MFLNVRFGYKSMKYLSLYLILFCMTVYCLIPIYKNQLQFIYFSRNFVTTSVRHTFNYYNSVFFII